MDTQSDARLHLPKVRRDMADIGIGLSTPVYVEIVAPQVLTGWGETESHWTVGGKVAELVRIRVVAGLTPTHFGMVVAHEMGHAWLAQRGANQASKVVEEGVCQLFAAAWLKRQRTAYADAVREGLRQDPDPVYGAGYRQVHAAVLRHGVDAVLDRVCRDGTLP